MLTILFTNFCLQDYEFLFFDISFLLPPDAAAEVERPLTLLGVAVPVYKFRGEDAQLECQYDQGTDPLYSVKWYKDDHEFFR